MPAPRFIEQIWHGGDPRLSSQALAVLLIPLGWLYRLIVRCRRLAYQTGLLAVRRVGAPVIVVGNITAGGAGKTPLVLWLAEYLRGRGFRPGIVSRGYGATPAKKPQQAEGDSDPAVVGDEPMLLAGRTKCPVVVAIRRPLAARELIARYGCDLIIADDGLQHYALGRDIEIAVIDGERRFGNGRCLPAGPLREPQGRLDSVDLVVSKHKAGRHEYKMAYRYGELVSLLDANKTRPLADLAGEAAHAVAGIAEPSRFFAHLQAGGIDIIRHAFPDHHPYSAADLAFNDGRAVVMTEKDAVKCRAFATQRCWYLPIRAELPDSFRYRLDQLLQEVMDGQKTA